MRHKLILSSLLLFTASASAEPLKIGLLLCETGSCAEWGTAAVKGAQLAAEELNSTSNLIELIVEDSAEDTVTRSVSAYRSLRQKGVALIIGPTWSAAGNAIAPIASKDSGVLMISPSVGVRDFNEAGENLFNVCPPDDLNSERMAAFAREQGFSRVAIFSAEQPWAVTQAKVFRKEFELRGGKIVEEFSLPPDERDMRMAATKIATSGAQAVVFTNYAEQLGMAAAQLNRVGFKGQKLSILMLQTSIDTAHGALEGAYYATYLPSRQSFRDKFKARFGADPGASADRAYDALKLIVQGAETAGGNNIAAISKALLAVKDYPGASGTITFSPDRSVVGKPLIFKVQSGKLGTVPIE